MPNQTTSNKKDTDSILSSLTDTDGLKKDGFIPKNMWGKDHYSLLAYIFTRNVDYESILDYNHMRLNSNRRVEYGRNFHSQWQDSYGTRLKGFWFNDSNGKSVTNPSLQLKDHDDFDCLDDFEAEGLIVRGTFISAYVSLTDKGRKLASKLMNHKAQGGQFADFEV